MIRNKKDTTYIFGDVGNAHWFTKNIKNTRWMVPIGTNYYSYPGKCGHYGKLRSKNRTSKEMVICMCSPSNGNRNVVDDLINRHAEEVLHCFDFFCSHSMGGYNGPQCWAEFPCMVFDQVLAPRESGFRKFHSEILKPFSILKVFGSWKNTSGIRDQMFFSSEQSDSWIFFEHSQINQIWIKSMVLICFDH